MAPESVATGAAAEKRPIHHRRATCRACGGVQLREFLSLGPQPLANAFLHDASEFAEEQFFPLDVFFCETCSLVQVLDVIDPEVLFRDYVYVTGISDTIATHNERYAQSVIEELGVGPQDLVVEIASNDGSLLSCFARRGVRTLGVEPALNIARMARERGIETVDQFFDLQTARQLRAHYATAKAVIGNNVLAHVDDTRGFLAGCLELVGETGTVIIEVPYAQDMHSRGEYDTIYHEHLCYFSITALARVAEAVGLAVTRVDRLPIHGGSVRVFFRRSNGQAHGEGPAALMAEERERGLVSLESWQAFGRAASENRVAACAAVEQLRAEGKTVAAYGAPAKGNTFLNYCGIDPSLVSYTVDRNPLKVGTFTPGMHLPVLPVETLLERQPDCVLILAWNFADEIVSQQAEYRRRGGRFLVAIPSPRFI